MASDLIQISDPTFLGEPVLVVRSVESLIAVMLISYSSCALILNDPVKVFSGTNLIQLFCRISDSSEKLEG